MPTERWTPDQVPETNPWNMPSLWDALRRGFMCRCPSCGEGHVFRGFLKVVKQCEVCAAPLGLARADDAPPYFTILLVGHVVVPLLYFVDRAYSPDMWVMCAMFLPLTLALALGLLRPIKGATVGLMLHLNMLKPDELTAA